MPIECTLNVLLDSEMFNFFETLSTRYISTTNYILEMDVYYVHDFKSHLTNMYMCASSDHIRANALQYIDRALVLKFCKREREPT